MKIMMTANTSFMIANFRSGLIRALIEDGHEVVSLSPADDYSDKLRDLGCRVIPLAVDGKGTNPLVEAKQLIAMFLAIRREEPDVVLGYTIKNNIYGGIAARCLRIPFVPNVTGLGTSFASEQWLASLVRRMYKFAFRRSPVVFFQNADDLALFMSDHIIAAQQGALLPGSGVDLARFHYHEAITDHQEGCVSFLMVCRMLWDKGVREFADAARQLKDEMPGLRFQLLGPLNSGNRNAVTSEEMRELTRGGYVEYVGATKDVFPFLVEASCVVLPSYYREGTPRSLLEAAAVGRPVITTDSPGCRDVVVDGVTGFLCIPRSSAELAEKMRRFASMSSVDRCRMWQRGRERMEQGFDEKIVIGRYRDALKQIGASGQGSL